MLPARSSTSLLAGRCARARAIEFASEQIEDGGPIPADLWKGIMREGRKTWISGSVHLHASDQDSGGRALSITGIRFEVMDLHRLIRYQCGSLETLIPTAVEPESTTQTDRSAPAKRPPRTADTSAIPPGALLATVSHAMVALGLGRTKANELMNDGRLVRRHIDGGVRIMVAGSMALLAHGQILDFATARDSSRKQPDGVGGTLTSSR